MNTRTTILNSRHDLTFDDLKGLKAQGYIRDSTIDQKDGYGPELQKKAIENFAKTYGLNLGDRWFTDFISGRSTHKRSGFQSALLAAELNHFDVLLVYHTSRFARNRADAIRYKAELKKSGKILVFVSQNIISGRDTDFLNEGLNEILDENYSRTLSGWVTDGLRSKHDDSIANGKPSLGYKSQKYDNGQHEVKVPDFDGKDGDPKKGGIGALIHLLQEYSTGLYSYDTLAEHLNACGYRTRLGDLFTSSGVEVVLSNRFYEGKAVYHEGKTDEDVRDGKHIVPEEVRSLWIKCQSMKYHRTQRKQGRPPSENRSYPFSKVSVCDECNRHYGGRPVLQRSGDIVQRLYHTRPFCHIEPHSIKLENIMAQFHDGVLPYINLDNGWKNLVLNCLNPDKNTTSNNDTRAKIEQALKNLRKQHLWGDITDQEYHKEKQEMERELNSLAVLNLPVDFSNLDKAAQLLSDLPSLWEHPGTTDRLRESLIGQVFDETRLRGNQLVAIKPQPQYLPLFAYITSKAVSKSRGEWIRTTDLSVPNAAR